jgi:hypothetical protein
MSRRWWIVVFVLTVPFIAVQLVPVQLPQNMPDVADDLMTVMEVPEDIEYLLKEGCYDCHSQQVRYPWYAYVAPVSWLVAKDVRGGREELDFSFWGTLGIRKQIGALTDIAEQVQQEEMPLPIYTTLHPQARFSEQERARIVEWSEAAASEILGD